MLSIVYYLASRFFKTMKYLYGKQTRVFALRKFHKVSSELSAGFSVYVTCINRNENCFTSVGFVKGFK